MAALKFKEIPPNPTNTDLGEALAAIHECIEAGKRDTAKNRRSVLRLIADNRAEAGDRADGLESMIAAHRDATEKRFGENAAGFVIWLEGYNKQNEQLTKLISAIGADKNGRPHKSIVSLSQGQATLRLIAAIGGATLAIPLAAKIINAAWVSGIVPALHAIGVVLLK